MSKAMVLAQRPGAPGKCYHALTLTTTDSIPQAPVSKNSVKLSFLAASLNHRDLFQRRSLYPGTAFGIPILSDGCAVLISPRSHNLYGRRVLVNPSRGWVSSPIAPESTFATLGASVHYPTGTLQEVGDFDSEEIVEAPMHLTDEQAAALPLCGTTAYRAVFSKGQVRSGDVVLVTGIGGGVALMALQFCVAVGAIVWVSSSSPTKLARAKELGAEGGVLYTNPDWPKQLPENVDAVIDGAGGDIVGRVSRKLRQGAKIVVYGMTTGPSMPWPMTAVLKNVDMLGSTMGSRREFSEMVEFVGKHGIRPVVDEVIDGLVPEKLEGLFRKMDQGEQFGKLVVRVKLRKDVQEAKL